MPTRFTMCQSLIVPCRLGMAKITLAICVIMVYAPWSYGQTPFLTAPKFDTVQSAVFSRRAYPNPGDIPVLNRKVFRGTRVVVNEHPYVVSVRRLHAHYLTGAIISARVVVTVAHPINNVSVTELGVVAGQTYCDRGAAYLTVLVVVIHNEFNPYTLSGDLALLRIYETIFPKSTQKPIALFEGFHATQLSKYKEKRHDPEKAFVTGWGRCDWNGNELCLPRSSVYYPDEKLDPMLRTISFNHSLLAQSPYCVGYEKHMIRLNDVGMLCVGSAREVEPLAPCLAVPGAPLVVDGQLVGLLSWGFGCGYTNDLPLVYTDLRVYHGWIDSNLGKLENLDPKEVSELYIATTAYIMEEWLGQTTGRRPAGLPVRDPQLRAADVDYRLIAISGFITDFRDYAYGGALRIPKMELYRSLRSESDYKLQIQRISEHIMLNMKLPKPFLSNSYGLNNLIDDTIKNEK